jgi:beta-lactamase regulating signal transducer with metallopeptidase domain
MEALVHAMLSNALVATILALPPLVLARFGRSPALVHSLWLVVLLKLVTPPLLTIPLPDFARVRQDSDSNPVAQYRETMARLPSRITVDEMTGSETGITADEWEASYSELTGPAEPSEPRRAEPPARHGSESLDRLIVAHWHALFLLSVLIGSLVIWFLAVVRIIGFQRLLRDIRPAPAELQKQLDALADRLDLRRAPSIWLAPGRLPPMLWALGGRARLLVPSEFWQVLDQDHQLALLAHELAHLKRKDHWVRWLDLVVAGLYWWHPVLWWARSGLRDAEEQCCDAWAVWAAPGGPRTYATALLAALEFVADAPTAGVAAAAAVVSGRRHVSCLKRRMSMIVRARTLKGLSWTGRAGVLGLSVLILPLAPTWAQKPGNLSSDTPSALLAAIATDGPASAEAAPAGRPADLQAQEPSEPRADRPDGASRQQEAAERLQKRLTELGDKLVKDLGPLGEEVRKALENAANEVSDTLKKEDLSGDDIRNALERARDQVRKAFETGGPVEKEAREAFEKARRDMRESVENAHRELRETMLSRREEAEKQSLRDERSKDEPGEAQSPAEDLEKARSEVRKMEQELRRAMRRLDALERREGRVTRREQRQNPGATPARPEAPPRPPAPPRPRVAPRPPAPPVPPEAPDTRPEPAPSPDAVPTPAPRPLRRPGPAGGVRGPGGPAGDFIPVPGGPGGPVANPRVERRLRDLESKLDRLLKEIEGLKGEKKDKANEKDDEEDDDQALLSRPAPLTSRDFPGFP